MPTDFYRWEEGGALVHHCPQCHVPLTNKRTKLRCLGHHVEWCKKYHTQLFKAGGSAVCMACINSDEQKHLRYKEIAELVKNLRNVSKEQEFSTPTKKSAKFNHAAVGSASKKDRKEAKRVAKAAERAPVTGQKEIGRIGEVLHPGASAEAEFEKSLLKDDSIKENVYYHANTSNSHDARDRFMTQERAIKGERKLPDHEMDRIMTDLNVPALSQAKDKAERGIINRLRDKIAEDFVHDHGEVSQTMMRKAGFWRWANRKVYNRLAENGRIWDWKSGNALAPVAEQEAEAEAEEGLPGAEESTDEDEEAAELQSMISGDESASSASRTTSNASEEDLEGGWATAGVPSSPSTPKQPQFVIKMSGNGGLGRLRDNSTPTPRTPDRVKFSDFSFLSIADDEE